MTVGEDGDGLVEMLNMMPTLSGSIVILLPPVTKLLMVELKAVEEESVVFSPAFDTPSSSDRVANSQKLWGGGGWGHRNSILPPGHTTVRGETWAVRFSSC